MLRPNTSTRNKGCKSIFKALYAMYYEHLCPGVGGVALSRHQYVLLLKSGHFLTPSLLPSLPSLPNSLLQPHLNHTLTTPQPNLNFMSPLLSTSIFQSRSSPPALFFPQYSLHVLCHPSTPSIPEVHPRPFPSLPNSCYLSPESLNVPSPILPSRMCAVVGGYLQ